MRIIFSAAVGLTLMALSLLYSAQPLAQNTEPEPTASPAQAQTPSVQPTEPMATSMSPPSTESSPAMPPVEMAPQPQTASALTQTMERYELDLKPLNEAGPRALAANPYVIDAYPFTKSNPSDPLHAAFAQCPSEGWRASMSVSAQNTKITDTNGNLEVAKTNGTTGSGARPVWNKNYLGVTSDGTTSWINAGPGVVSAGPCTVVATPGNYPVTSSLFVGVGGPNATQELLTFPGAKINFTRSLGKGGAGVVVANKGSVIGLNSQSGGSISGSGPALDSVVESWSGFAASALGMFQSQTPNMDVQGEYISSGRSPINKGIVWIAGVEGQLSFQNNSVAMGGPNQVAILTDDTNQQWNALLFHNIWILGNHATGVNGVGYRFVCGAKSQGGSQSAQVIGGAIVDFAGDHPIFFDVQGTPSAPCKSIVDLGTYYETSTQNPGTGIGINLNNAEDFEAYGVELNGGPRLAQAVKISGTGMVHVMGYCYGNACGPGTNVILNTTTGRTVNGRGSFNYTYTPIDASHTPPIFDGAKPQ